MNQHRIRLLTGFVLVAAAVAVLPWTGDEVGAQAKSTTKGKVTRDRAYVEKFKRVAPSEQKAAAKRAAVLGLKPGNERARDERGEDGDRDQVRGRGDRKPPVPARALLRPLAEGNIGGNGAHAALTIGRPCRMSVS